jgi:regulator of protease activity HflC (stomatin/prohibitin superfamily)
MHDGNMDKCPQAWHRGVVLYLGAVENRVLGEGLHFIIPFAEQVIQLEAIIVSEPD